MRVCVPVCVRVCRWLRNDNKNNNTSSYN